LLRVRKQLLHGLPRELLLLTGTCCQNHAGDNVPDGAEFLLPENIVATENAEQV